MNIFSLDIILLWVEVAERLLARDPSSATTDTSERALKHAQRSRTSLIGHDQLLTPDPEELNYSLQLDILEINASRIHMLARSTSSVVSKTMMTVCRISYVILGKEGCDP